MYGFNAIISQSSRVKPQTYGTGRLFLWVIRVHVQVQVLCHIFGARMQLLLLAETHVVDRTGWSHLPRGLERYFSALAASATKT